MNIITQPAASGMDGQAPPPAGFATAPGWQAHGADLLPVLRRGAVPIVGCAVAGAVAAYVYAGTLPKSYTAESAIAVEGDRLAIPELQGVLRSDASPDPMPFVRTEVQALGSRQLLSRLAGELALDRNPEFNAALRPPTLAGRITAAVKSLLPHRQDAAGPDGGHDAVVNAVGHALTITQDNRSLVIGVAFAAHDPNLAAAAINRLIADYLGERTRRRVDADQGANAALTQRIDEVRGDIQHLEKQMQDLRSSSGIVSLRAGSVGQQQVEDLTTEAGRAAVQRSEIQANLARATAAAATGSSAELEAVLGSQTTSRLREQESEASGRVADLSAQFGPQYPALKSARADLGAVRAQLGGEAHRIVASLATELKVAQAHEADVQAQLAVARKAGAAAQDVQAQLDQLQQDVVTRRTLYSTLLERAQQTVAQPHADSLPDVRVLSAATPPGLPSAPNMKLAGGLAGAAGGLIACLVAFVRSAGHRRFRDEADIRTISGATILATIPDLRGSSWQRLGTLAPSALPEKQAAALRIATARLRGAGGGTPPQVVALVGSQPGGQASAAAIAFARVAAADGKTVLLVEHAGRRRDISRLLGARAAPARPAAHADWRDGVVRDGAAPLDLLTGGTVPAETAGRAVALENLLVEARDDYDLIVLGAPEAADAEALSLARSSDVTIIVVDAARAAPEATRATTQRLAAVTRNRLAAIVLGTP